MNNRVIKFRIWDKRNNKFWFSGTIPDFINFICPFYSKMSGLEAMIFDWDEFTFQQFTGLLDKNNKEIYEGDIISEHDKSRKKYENGEIIWSKEYLTYLSKKWNFNKTDFWSDFLYNLSGEKEFEIIGNIFENPELLKNKE